MEKYTIPQEINQWDKFGIFTLPQVIALGIGGVLCLFSMSVFHILIGILISIPIAIATGVAMFKKIEKIPIYEFVLVYIVYISTPKRYVYRTNNLKDNYLDEEDIILLIDDDEEDEEIEYV